MVITASDPPGAASRRNAATPHHSTAEYDDGDRPSTTRSNPSSYHSHSSSHATTSSSAGTTGRGSNISSATGDTTCAHNRSAVHDADNAPFSYRGSTDNGDYHNDPRHRPAYRRRLTGATAMTGMTAQGAYFHDPYHADPVDSVYGGSTDARHRPSFLDEDRRRRPGPGPGGPGGGEHDRSWAQQSSSTGLVSEGYTQYTIVDDNASNVFDEDEDNCEEHYRVRPTPRLPPIPKNNHPAPAPPPSQEAWREARSPPIPREAIREEHRLVPHAPTPTPPPSSSSAGERKKQLEPEERTTKTSSEVVANIRSQLALARVDPAPVAPSRKYGGYEHCFITVEEEHRSIVLHAFLKRQASSKAMVFFSTSESARYYARLLRRLGLDDVAAAHDGLSEEGFRDEISKFSRRGGGGALCVPDPRGSERATAVAVPPSCSWIVQFEPCACPSEYIYRVGRVSSERGAGSAFNPSPRALAFLTPSQFGFLKYYKAAGVKFSEYEIPRLENVGKELTRRVREDAKLGRLGTEAYHAYLAEYAKHDYRDIYDVRELDPKRVARCFGFDKPPPPKDDANGGPNDKKQAARASIPKNPMNRESTRWKPKKHEKRGWSTEKPEKRGWMTREKSWKFADVHAGKWNAKNDSKTNPNDFKPKTITLR